MQPDRIHTIRLEASDVVLAVHQMHIPQHMPHRERFESGQARPEGFQVEILKGKGRVRWVRLVITKTTTSSFIDLCSHCVTMPTS
jgi:hypothetical protein